MSKNYIKGQFDSAGLISVIIPVYQVDKYLSACLDSLLAQSYQRLEIILIDDGSKDESGRICEAYRARDQRISVIHQEHQGPSGARNVGIEVSTGPFLFFLDSDDILPMSALEELYTSIQSSGADIALGHFQRFQAYEETKYYADVTLGHSQKIVNDNELLAMQKEAVPENEKEKCVFAKRFSGRNRMETSDDSAPEKKHMGKSRMLTSDAINPWKIYAGECQMEALFRDTDFPVMVWGKLYRRELFGDIRFPVGKLYEDEFTTYRVLALSRSSVMIPEIVYYYRKNPKGIMNQSYNAYSSHTMQLLDAAEEQLRFVKEKYPSCIDAAREKRVYCALQCAIKLLRTKEAQEQVYLDQKRCLKVIRKDLLFFVFKGKNRMKTKLFAILYGLNPAFCKIIT